MKAALKGTQVRFGHFWKTPDLNTNISLVRSVPGSKQATEVMLDPLGGSFVVYFDHPDSSARQAIASGDFKTITIDPQKDGIELTQYEGDFVKISHGISSDGTVTTTYSPKNISDEFKL